MISIWRTKQSLAEERYERAQAVTEQLARLAERSLAAEPARAGWADAVAELTRVGGAEEIALFELPSGELVAPAGAAALESDARGRTAAGAGMAPHAQERPGAPGRVVLYAGVLGPRGARAVLRATFAIDASIDRTLQRTRRTVLIIGVLNGVVLLAAAAMILRSSVVRPVLALERAAGRVAAGDLEARVAVRGPGELGRLAIAFEQMTQSLRTGRDSLIRSEKLAGVGRLAAGVAHEVGNPLAAILGYTEMLLGETPDKPIDPALRQDMLTRVRGETERIHRIIQELLDYSKPTREDAPESVAVAPIVDGALSLVKAQARLRDVEARLELPATLPPVRATTSRLTQVMLNLLLNAADAMDGQGTIVVDGRVLPGGQRVVIGVSDSGPGVPAELRGKVFDPFFTTKEPGRGTGLGLSVCLAIVEGYGGTLRVGDLPTGVRGARFEIELPVATTAAAG